MPSCQRFAWALPGRVGRSSRPLPCQSNRHVRWPALVNAYSPGNAGLHPVPDVHVRYVDGTRWSYQKFRQRSHEWATAGVVAIAPPDAPVRFALMNLAETSVRARAADAPLMGVLSALSTNVRPCCDARANVEFRRELARVLAGRAPHGSRSLSGYFAAADASAPASERSRGCVINPCSQGAWSTSRCSGNSTGSHSRRPMTGSVSLLITTFDVAAEAEEACDFVAEVCAWMSNPTVDDLEHECVCDQRRRTWLRF
jgi:hypothetical protein